MKLNFNTKKFINENFSANYQYTKKLLITREEKKDNRKLRGRERAYDLVVVFYIVCGAEQKKNWRNNKYHTREINNKSLSRAHLTYLAHFFIFLFFVLRKLRLFFDNFFLLSLVVIWSKTMLSSHLNLNQIFFAVFLTHLNFSSLLIFIDFFFVM